MRRVVTIAAMVLTTAGAAGAQSQDVFFFQADNAAPMMFEHAVDVMMAEPFDLGKPVAGAPYAADITTEIVQVLADGNRIERRSTSSVARDSAGRVRRTQQLTAIGPMLPPAGARIVTIQDPVAGTFYSLDDERKVALQSPPMFTKRLEGPAPRPHPGGAPPGESKTESLGVRQFEGVSAEGTRSVVTIAAGAIGNQAPIEIVSERWYSKDLQTVVYSRRSDPRFGETIFRLENITRAEPPAELFQVPSDYTVQSGPPFGAGVRIERRIQQ